MLLDEVGHVRTSLIELNNLETLVDAPVDERTPRVHLVGDARSSTPLHKAGDTNRSSDDEDFRPGAVDLLPLAQH